MKSYIGCKLVEAEPMTREEYNKLREWNIPENENPDDQGYLVKYDDDYISWSPKEIFEKQHLELFLSKEQYMESENHIPSIKDLERLMGERCCQLFTFTDDELKLLELPHDYKSNKYEISYTFGGYKHSDFGTEDEIESIDEYLKDQAWLVLIILINIAINGFKKGNE